MRKSHACRNIYKSLQNLQPRKFPKYKTINFTFYKMWGDRRLPNGFAPCPEKVNKTDNTDIYCRSLTRIFHYEFTACKC